MVTLPLSLCLLYSHHVYITYTQYIWTIPKRWVLLTLQPLDHSTIECHGLGDPSHAPCQATWCRSRPSAAPQALAPQAPAPRATARAPQARAQARLERAQPSAPAKRGTLSLMTQITRGYSWLLGWMSCHKVAMYVIYHIHIYIYIYTYFYIYYITYIIYIYIYILSIYIYIIYIIYTIIYIYKDSPVSRPHFLLCKVRIVNLKKIKHGEKHPNSAPKRETFPTYPQRVPAKPKEHPQPRYAKFFPSSPAIPKTREGLTPPHATLVHSFLVLFSGGKIWGGP